MLPAIWQRSPVRAEEQVAQGLAPEQAKPPPAPVLSPVVQQVTALAERGQVARPVVGWIVIPVRRGQNHPRAPNPLQNLWGDRHAPP
jgi:hypothetical protein